MPLHITNLPAELLSDIARNVISKEDLCQLRSVNSLFETLATPEIFNSITVRNNKQSADRFWTLLLTPRIASHVQSISYVEECTLAEDQVWKRLEVAFSILHRAPGLKTLKFDFDPYYSDHGTAVLVSYYSHQWDIFYALGRNQKPLSALQSLQIYGWICCKDELMSLFDKAPIAWLAASLRHLSFTIPATTMVDSMYSVERFWKQVVVQRVLQPAVNLESLEIIGSIYLGECEDAKYFDVSQAQVATFPRLAVLSLKCIVWEDGISDPLEFVLRHQKTLKKLKLNTCPINVRWRSGPTHYWADIYKRLANALTELVELNVEFELKEDRIPYVSYSYFLLTNDDLKKGEAGDADLEQDALALEEFRAVVKSRRMGATEKEDRSAGA